MSVPLLALIPMALLCLTALTVVGVFVLVALTDERVPEIERSGVFFSPGGGLVETLSPIPESQTA